MSNISGAYSATYNANALGITNKGFQLSYQIFKEKIVGDVLGDSTLDSIYLGADSYFDTVLNEYNAAGAQAAFWPYHPTFGKLGLIGQSDSLVASALVLTAIPNTKAAAEIAATITIPVAILAEGFPVEMLFSSRHRKVPLRMQCLPTQVGAVTTGTEGHFTVA